MASIFRLDGAVPHEPAIDAWLASRPPALGAMAKTWFDRMRACGEDVRELMHDGGPVACIVDVPFGYVHVFRAHVNVGFYRGFALADPKKLLQGVGQRMRHVKCRPGEPMEDAALHELIRWACLDVRALVKP